MNLKQYQRIAAAFEAPDPSSGIDIRTQAQENDEVVIFEGLDMAIVGTVSRCGFATVLCYSRDRIREILMVRDGMDRQAAEEFIDFNIAGMYAGPQTPMLLST